VPTAEVDAAHAAASFHPESETHRDLSHVSIAAEPRRALDGGSDGLELIRRLVAELPRLLRPGGAALLEFGDGQSAAIVQLVDGLGLGWRVAIRDDLAGHPRMAEVRRSG
jgi:release factor glutamine methyltransferase